MMYLFVLEGECFFVTFCRYVNVFHH